MDTEMEKPHLPGYIVLGRKPTDNAYQGVIELSFSMGLSPDRVNFNWSLDNATSNFGGNFKVDGLKLAEKAKKTFTEAYPDMEFEIFDVHNDELPVIINWDQWRRDSAQDLKTLSGVKYKMGARNPRFEMR